MGIVNKHIVNSNGRGQDKNRETWHALRRTTQGALWYQKRDKNNLGEIFTQTSYR